MLLKTVSKYTVSFENSKFPELKSNSKSFRHELQKTRMLIVNRKYAILFVIVKVHCL